MDTDIRAKLSKYVLTQQWLRYQLNKSGINCDNAELCRAVNGLSNSPKSRKLLEASENILNKYNVCFGGEYDSRDYTTQD